MQKPTLVAVDTNVVLLLAVEDGSTIDAWETIKNRIKPIQFLIPPTVIQELAFKSRADGDVAEGEIAQKALASFRSGWNFQPAVLNAVEQGIAQQAASRLREQAILPFEERHDALVLAETALLGCALLLTHDSHLRDIDFPRVTLLFRQLDIPVPVIATPAELIKKFYR
jgi:predicted nucleic acid-binding protein